MTSSQFKQFSEEEYKINTKAIVQYAIENGGAVIVRKDGSIRIVITIPSADLDLAIDDLDVAPTHP